MRRSQSKDTDEDKPPKKRARCKHCTKWGHEEDQCGTKNPELCPGKMRQKEDQKHESHVVLAITDFQRLIAKQTKKAKEKNSTSSKEMETSWLAFNTEEDE